MSKIAFCFPGQGSLEEGMGREIAEAVPGGDAGDGGRRARRAASTSSGSASRRRSRSSCRRRCSSRRWSPRAWRCWPRCAPAGSSPTSSSATRSASSPRSPRSTRSTSARRAPSCASAGWRWPRRRAAGPGSMAAILGLEDPVVEQLCRRIIGVWPANYNCPGQIVVSGENQAVEECCFEAESEGAKRTVKLKVSGAFHSPLVAAAAERLRPALDKVRVQRADVAVHVHGDRADRAGAALRASCSSTSSPSRCASRRRRRR